ncbi:acyl-CoA dehydrogenase family protein [Mycobacterium koreense]|uniref:Pimeloyl-CoA dehydrogenase small subunit n=1 Tax=Mycolicibacillus koreensis TaxID=1069220 RepID=A0A7I7S9A8_9MYCO|nr:acyl-CoA dehydrogenase [Mycolicibacillus koreensis]MCV7247054.1 acyl-CoA dehydrogenase family protein [Mycolicibacillus koreensis]OSC35073.1 pimeloyl-CoA dehydrogenase small subunit [Mycolicibacillus koreensis]BBY53467.1 acyl-CoA dehydrogenase [Mycolicibacillus koreensis]
MDFTFTDEQQLLRDTVTRFLANRYTMEDSRAAAKTGPGWQPEIWRAFAGELGILGATFPEELGGLDGGPTELMIITEALGHALVIEPYVETVVLGGGLLQRAGGPGTQSLLHQIAAGTAVVALAAEEPTSGGAWHDISTTARRDGEHWVLNGEKVLVSAAPLATHLLVTARTGGSRRDTAGISVFAVEITPGALSSGLAMQPMRTIDDRRAADLTLTDLRLPAEALLGDEGQAWPSLERAYDEGAAAVVSEAVGCLRRVLADTVDYTKQRQQFGQPIGQFQALQHRMVDMYMEVEQAVAAQYLAILKLDAEPRERARAVSAAKATVARAARFVGQNAVQLHGAMGMTEELAVGHYFKRLTAIESEFGTRDRHLNRYATLVDGR